MKNKPTQLQVILDHLKEGYAITALDALNLYGCFRLAARINDIKAMGFAIQSEPYMTPGGARIARYTLTN